jgi:hypothetical protein
MNKAQLEYPTVAIAEKRTFGVDDKKFTERHTPLVNKLAEYGVRGIALSGATDRESDKVFNRYFDFDTRDFILNEYNQPIEVNAALDITGGIARYTPEVAALNPIGVREIVLSKQLQFDTLHNSVGEAMPVTVTVAVEKQEAAEALERFNGEKVIIKPSPDLSKKYGMLIGSTDSVLTQLDDYISTLSPKVKNLLIQEYMPEVNGDFAGGIRYFDNMEQDIADARPNLGRELRVHTIDGRPILVTGRVGLDAANRSPEDEWVHLDPNSIPDYVHNLASAASTLIQQTAEATDSYLAVDLTPDGKRIVEVNGRNIGTMRANGERKGAMRANEITTNELAQKLANMAHNNRGE